MLQYSILWPSLMLYHLSPKHYWPTDEPLAGECAPPGGPGGSGGCSGGARPRAGAGRRGAAAGGWPPPAWCRGRGRSVGSPRLQPGAGAPPPSLSTSRVTLSPEQRTADCVQCTVYSGVQYSRPAPGPACWHCCYNNETLPCPLSSVWSSIEVREQSLVRTPTITLPCPAPDTPLLLPSSSSYFTLQRMSPAQPSPVPLCVHTTGH